MAVASGIAPDDFWRLTPYQTRIIFERFNRVEFDNISKILYAAWHAALFQRARKLPSLQGILKKMHTARMQPADKRREIISSLRTFFKTAEARIKSGGKDNV